MIHNVFHLAPSVLEKVVRAALIYAFLVLALRVTSKREMTQISGTDFIVLMAVANAVQNGIIGDDNSVTGGVLSAATFFLLNHLVTKLTYRSEFWRHLINGRSARLVQDSQVCHDVLRREGITVETLEVALQRSGADLDDVQDAILEPGGGILIQRAISDQDRAIAELSTKLDLVLARLDARG